MRRTLLLMVCFILCVSCRRGSEIQVRVLYSAENPALPKLRQSEREFSFTDPRLHSGKPFHLTEVILSNPGQLIASKSKSGEADLIVLRSATELPDLPDLRKEMGDSFSICEQSVAYIPEWVNEERREGAARFLQYLSTHCR